MITTTPQEFAEQKARDLLISLILTQQLRQDPNPHDTVSQWKEVLIGSLKPNLHPPEYEYAEKLFHRFLDVALSNTGEAQP